MLLIRSLFPEYPSCEARFAAALKRIYNKIIFIFSYFNFEHLLSGFPRGGLGISPTARSKINGKILAHVQLISSIIFDLLFLILGSFIAKNKKK